MINVGWALLKKSLQGLQCSKPVKQQSLLFRETILYNIKYMLCIYIALKNIKYYERNQIRSDPLRCLFIGNPDEVNDLGFNFINET